MHQNVAVICVTAKSVLLYWSQENEEQGGPGHSVGDHRLKV